MPTPQLPYRIRPNTSVGVLGCLTLWKLEPASRSKKSRAGSQKLPSRGVIYDHLLLSKFNQEKHHRARARKWWPNGRQRISDVFLNFFWPLAVVRYSEQNKVFHLCKLRKFLSLVFFCFLLASQALGYDQLVSKHRPSPEPFALPVVPFDQFGFFELINVNFGFIQPAANFAPKLPHSKSCATVFARQPSENIKLFGWYILLSILLLLFLPICAKRFYFAARHIQLDFQIFILLFQSRYRRFLLLRRLAVLKSLRQFRESEELIPNLRQRWLLSPANRVSECVYSILEALWSLCGHIACEDQPNLKQ
jgi:hypothetical protein